MAMTPERVIPPQVLPIDDVEERLRIIRETVGSKKMETIKESALDVAVMMFVPIQFLEVIALWWAYELRQTRSARSVMRDMANFIRLFLQRTTSLIPSPAASPSPGGSRGSTKPLSRVSRSQPAKDLAAKRDDWECVLTGTAMPERAYIFPFSANHNLESLERLRGVSKMANLLWDKEWADNNDIDSGLLDGGIGCSDQYWNIICLSPVLHTLWAKCFWCFQFLEIIPGMSENDNAIIRLVFRWTKQRHHQRKLNTSKSRQEAIDIDKYWSRDIEFANDGILNFIKEWRDQREYGGRDTLGFGGVVAAADAANLRGLQSGHVVQFKMPLRDCIRMKAVVDLQYACIQIAGMSGAADDPAFLEWEEDSVDEDKFGVSVDAWLEEDLGEEYEVAEDEEADDIAILKGETAEDEY
ncbi:hypothetical protein V8F20_006526 [Naviculisporaceae sp. PSN 640]